jgi:hypothetical protein
MGLDIYLSKFENFEETQRKENQYKEYDEKYWESFGEYDNLTDEQKVAIRTHLKEYANTLGLDDWGSDGDNVGSIEFNDEQYPDHIFKIGYFRSSYNESGIERILRNYGLPTMGEIFGRDDDEYLFRPDWEIADKKAKQLIQVLKEKPEYRAHAVTGNLFKDASKLPQSESDALSIFLKEYDKTNNYNYSNSNGEFYPEKPMNVLALIPGIKTSFGERPCTYVIYEESNEWYIQALEILSRTIEYVLKQEDKDKYFLRWSA